MIVREATTADATACADIYAPYVRDTAISFELEAPSPEVMSDRIAAALRTFAWLVLEDDGRIAGYAYATTYRQREAYRWACETSVYLEPGRRRTGAGRALYAALFARLAERGFRLAIAGMTLPNDASVALHRRLGFEDVGTFRNVGWKNGAWHDVLMMQRALTDDDGPARRLV
ncbi:MAG: GNAT family N-acetyltransferase [Jatrophihabitantaceae bacterium]